MGLKPRKSFKQMKIQAKKNPENINVFTEMPNSNVKSKCAQQEILCMISSTFLMTFTKFHSNLILASLPIVTGSE